MKPVQLEFANRRQAILAEMLPDSVAIVAAASEQTRSNDTEYPFRQNSDFWYLSGFNEPDAYLLLVKKDGLEESILFCRAKNKLAEIWNGRRLGPEKAAEQLAFDHALPIEEFEEYARKVLNGATTLYWRHGDSELDQKVIALLKAVRNMGKLASTPHQLFDFSKIVHEKRLFKTESEIAIMQKAADISTDAHKRAMKVCQPGMYEYQVEAEIKHEFAMQGARFEAYNSIVAGGDNACILHYTENSELLQDGDLLLIDAGCEYQGYAADITRTFPVNGRFSEAQKQIYQLVLDAQTEALKVLKPGNTLQQATDVAVDVITLGLIDLGILTGTLADNKNSQNEQPPAYRKYFMHGLGHWLGLDVHDVGQYKCNGTERVLEPGMALTVEPGIYISEDADVEDKWKGIGVRIEDNIVITDDGYQILTANVPKTITEIESWMSANNA